MLCVLLLASGMMPIVSSADSDYEITVETEIDTPTRTVTVEGQTYTVDSMGKAPTGGDLTFSVDTPGVDRYRVSLYNSERQIVESTRRTEDGTVSFDTTGFASGTYVLTVSVSGVRKAVQPVVVTDYDIQIEAPSEVTASSSFEVSATLSGSSTTPEQVLVVVSNGTWHRQYAAAESGGAYTADVPGTLAAGQYSVYVTTHNDNEVDGRKEVTGLSSPSTVTVTAGESETPTDAPSAGGGGDGGNAGENSPTDAPDTTSTPNSTRTETVTPSGASTTDTPTGTITSDATPAERTDESDTATTDPNVIQPADATPEPTETTAPGVPVLGLILLVLVGAVTRLRSRRRS